MEQVGGSQAPGLVNTSVFICLISGHPVKSLNKVFQLHYWVKKMMISVLWKWNSVPSFLFLGWSLVFTQASITPSTMTPGSLSQDLHLHHPQDPIGHKSIWNPNISYSSPSNQLLSLIPTFTSRLFSVWASARE